MIVTSGENTSYITITPVTNGATVTIAPKTTGPAIEVNTGFTASIPAAFEQRVTDNENNITSLDGRVNALEIEESIEEYVYVQGPAANVWNINHNMGRFPAVTVVDSAGSMIMGELQYTDLNNLILTFINPFGGKAYLN